MQIKLKSPDETTVKIVDIQTCEVWTKTQRGWQIEKVGAEHIKKMLEGGH
jgi:hypothetical protein